MNGLGLATSKILCVISIALDSLGLATSKILCVISIALDSLWTLMIYNNYPDNQFPNQLKILLQEIQ